MNQNPSSKTQFYLSTLIVIVIIIGTSLTWCLAVIGVGGNLGYEFGYFGQFNRVQHVLEAMPNVKITDSWQHQDISLEDFGFTLLIDGTLTAKINFYEGTPESCETDKLALWQFI